jgi:hypothetical protein
MTIHGPKQPYIRPQDRQDTRIGFEAGFEPGFEAYDVMSLHIAADTIRHFFMDKGGTVSFIDEVTRREAAR